MTDRELLKLAAKAAGYDGLGMWDEKRGYLWDGEGWSFDPLNDDGDALRLAVKLHMNVYSGFKKMIAEIPSDGDVPNIMESCEKGDDPYAATRRAIVRAAAEIGRTM